MEGGGGNVEKREPSNFRIACAYKLESNGKGIVDPGGKDGGDLDTQLKIMCCSTVSRHTVFRKHILTQPSGTRSSQLQGTPTQNMPKTTTLSGVTRELLAKSTMH